MRRAGFLAAALTSLLLLSAGPAAADDIPYPMLDVAHALPTGLNLWEISLAGEDGSPFLVRTIDGGGFDYAQSRTATGYFGDVTPSDDGSPDWLISHQQPGGGILLWVVGGGGDTTPQLWADLRGGGWSWANSRQYVGDVDGDGLDDVVSVHRNQDAAGNTGVNVWVHHNTSSGFADPALWTSMIPTVVEGSDFILPTSMPFVDSRFLVGDVNGDGLADLTSIHRGNPGFSWRQFQENDFETTSILTLTWLNMGDGSLTRADSTHALASGGWSFDQSRDLLADVNGDGVNELVHVHAQPNGGILGWARTWLDFPHDYTEPELIADLRGGGWSYTGSRQVAADVDGDGADDIVSIHDQVSGGELVWAHLTEPSTHRLAVPQIIADLRTGGWDFRASRETVGQFWVTQ